LTSGAYNGSTINLPGGHYTLTAEYAGDSTFSSSSSTPVSVTVTPENSALSGTSFAYSRFYVLGQRRIIQTNTTQLGNPFWLQFQVNGLSGSSDATGSIKLSQGGKVFGTYPVSSTGTIYVQCGPDTECDFGPGTYTFQADYSGDNSFNASSSTLTFTISKGLAYWETRANIVTPVAGSRVIGYVYFSADPAVPPTGTVTLTRSDTGGLLGTGTIDKTGTVTIPFSAPAGEYFLNASYNGDTNYGVGGQHSSQEIITGSTSGTKAANISLNLGTTSFSLGQRTPFSVAVTPSTSGSTAAPIGYVTLYSSNGQISGKIGLSGGKATGIVEWDSVGTQGVYAVYGGDGNFAGGSSATVTVHVAQAVPTITVKPATDRVAVGAETSMTALLTSPLASTNAPALTGTIQFFDAVNGGPVHAIGAPQVVVGGNGGTLIATLATTLPKGTNVITAVYSGDANWKSAVSAPLPIDVSNHQHCQQSDDCDATGR
jgi:hypothetical protein